MSIVDPHIHRMRTAMRVGAACSGERIQSTMKSLAPVMVEDRCGSAPSAT